MMDKASPGLAGKLVCALLGDFPKIVRLETTNACNAACTICPHGEMQRPVQRMDEVLFTRLIDECAANGCREVHLHNFGEPLLDTRLERFVAYGKSKGIAKVKIFTNGALMTAERAGKLLEAGIDEIKISFDGASREEFESIRRPLRFDEVVNNILQLVELRDRLGARAKIKVACCSTSSQTGTMDLLQSKVDGFSFGRIHNWGTTSHDAGKSRLRKPCSRVWRTFTVLAGGEVSLCCLDYDGQVVLGHLNDEASSIRSIWRNEQYRAVRAEHKAGRQGRLALCAACSKSFV
jgi:sulfatase maturation enzyme AslB (radical SAM superfamily)